MVTLLIALVANVSMAKPKPSEEISVEVTLANGKKVAGTLKDYKLSSFYDATGYHLTTIGSVTLVSGNKEQSYTPEDLKSMKMKTKDGIIDYLSLHGIKKFTLPKNMNASKSKYLWQVIYKGGNVIGLGLPSNNSYWVSSSAHVSLNTYALAYCLKGDEIAVVYYVPEKGASGKKGEVKRSFDRFPKMEEYFKGDDFSMKAFKKDPLSILKVLEKNYK